MSDELIGVFHKPFEFNETGLGLDLDEHGVAELSGCRGQGQVIHTDIRFAGNDSDQAFHWFTCAVIYGNIGLI